MTDHSLFKGNYRRLAGTSGSTGSLDQIRDESLLWPIGVGDAFPARVEKFHFWPWTYAGNLFGLIAATAGVVGIISYYRRSYTSLILFMTLCLLSVGFCGYLIGYFSVLVNYYNRLNYMAPGHAQTVDTSFGIIVANLVISIILTILAAIAALLAALALSLCRHKGLHFDKYRPYYVPDRSQGAIVPQTYM